MHGMLAAERDKATRLMAEGLTSQVKGLHASGKLKGIIAVTGLTGALITLKAMKALPFGVPKLLVSSGVSQPSNAARLAEYYASRDITVMHAVVDTVGMNGFVEALAVNGANAISGMVESVETGTERKKPSVALTEYGFCEKGAHYVRESLGGEYEVVSFHATGLGDRAALDFVGQGLFKAFVDLVPSRIGEYLLGGNRASGPSRLDACRQSRSPISFLRAASTC